MALDVRLTRDVNEKWGFEVIGGADDETTLTVQKLQPSSPAERCGLQNGDAIFAINGEEAIDFTNEEACRKIAESGEILTLGLMRGLYDPVLDDQEPIYYEPGDLDPQSQPTEVPFKIQKFVEPEDLGNRAINFGANGEPLDISYDPSILLLDSRSLTASPFVTPTKPYRPFSTEPIPQVPPLEDPIILNPEYKDEFIEGTNEINPDYILNAYYLDGLKSKFKLPISEQYDPDGTKQVRNVEVDSVLSKYIKMEMLSKQSAVTTETINDKSVKIKETLSNKTSIHDDKRNGNNNFATTNTEVEDNTVKQEEGLKKYMMMDKSDLIVTEDVADKLIDGEIKYNKITVQKTDTSQIEKTAILVVDDSIERAVSVTEEIKEEIEKDLHGEAAIKSEVAKIELDKKLISSRFETNESQLDTTDQKLFKQEQNRETVVTEEILTTDKPDKINEINTNVAYESKPETSNEFEKEAIKETSITHENRRSFVKNIQKLENKGESKTVTKTTTGTKSEKTGSHERTHAIGLQTIPNIRGVVHSSYHYDLLLKTFFIHLTDVMVALSRFVLTQPVFNAVSQKTHETVSKTKLDESSIRCERANKQEVIESVNKAKNQSYNKSKMNIEMKQEKTIEDIEKMEKQDQIMQEKYASNDRVTETKRKVKERTRDLMTPVGFEETENQSERLQTIAALELKEKVEEKKIKSGAQMAQRSEKKLTKDITQKMDAVISEFHTIAADEDKMSIFQRNSRSRSKSQIEEEVAKESDPLEWLSKDDTRGASQRADRLSISKQQYSSSKGTIEKKRFEEQEIINKKFKTPKQMYVGVVEAHVYTNKDVIFEDAAEFSETSSIQSAEEINTAFEAIEAITTKNVALESAVQQIEHGQICEDSNTRARVNIQNVTTVRESNETQQENESIIKEYNKERALLSKDIKENIQESTEIIVPVVEIKESIIKERVAADISETRSTAEFNVIDSHESSNEFKVFESVKENTAIVEEDYRENIIELESEIMESTNNESKTLSIDIDVQIKEVSANIVQSQQEPYNGGDDYATLKTIQKVETEVESINHIIEIENVLDISQNVDENIIVDKIEVINDLGLDKSKEITETSIVSSEFGLAKSEVSVESSSKITSEIDICLPSVTQTKNYKSESYISDETVYESLSTTQSIDKKLKLRTDLDTQKSVESECSTIDTPTPSAVPPTPLTDEYVFKLTIPLPKSRGTTPVPRDCTLSPEDEDPHIVKKKLIPHIETTIEKVVYDPPLPTPTDKVQCPIFKIPGLFGGSSKSILKPVYRKPGLFGGADSPQYGKEEIKEIERKSSLLASAIDETIKSIEEYKEEVGIEKKKEVTVVDYKEKTVSDCYQKNYSQGVIEKSQQNGFKEDHITMDEIIETNGNIVSTKHNKNSSTKEEEIWKNEVLESSIMINNSLKEVSKIPETDISVSEHIESRVQGETSEADTVKKIEIIPNGKHNLASDKEKSISTFSLAETIEQIEDKANFNKETKPVENGAISNCESAIPEVIKEEEKKDPMLGFRPVVFEPETIQKHIIHNTPNEQVPQVQEARQSPYVTDSGEIIGTIQGIVDGLEEPVLNAEVAQDLGKPGITEEKIAELISGEAEMLRVAHVMGLSRVLNSHMHRVDDSSVDFQKIKPMIASLKNSEVLKALNEELARQKEEQKNKEEKRWTTFLQKPKRPIPKAKFGYHGWTEVEGTFVEEPYKVKIVKQSKPKVAPDYKPEDFETGPLPWEERAEVEASLPPVEPEEPILVPEVPEFLEAVDPLNESEVPDLEDTGIPLPPPRDPTPPPEETTQDIAVEQEPEVQVKEEIIHEEKKTGEQKEIEESMENRLAEQLVKSVQSMVDPNATIEQQLCQMRAQLAALAQLPEVIQQSLELVSRQLNKMTHQEPPVNKEFQSYLEIEVNHNDASGDEEVHIIENSDVIQNQDAPKENGFNDVTIEVKEDNMETGEQQFVQEENRVQTPQVIEEEMRMEKIKKEQLYKEQMDSDGRQIKQRATPRVGKPKRMFGPLDPDSRPVVLPGGRRWRNTEDVYNEQMIAETLQAQSELLQGKIMGFESELLPYDDRINFMKYEKPPVNLDHLKHSETYKLVHDMDQPPLKRVEMLTPVIAEADYRERCRSMTPSGDKKHLLIPQQFHP